MKLSLADLNFDDDDFDLDRPQPIKRQKPLNGKDDMSTKDRDLWLAAARKHKSQE